MLTKNDLLQIGLVIDERLEIKLNETLDARFAPITKDLKTIKKDVKYLKKTVNVVIKNYDETDNKFGKR